MQPAGGDKEHLDKVLKAIYFILSNSKTLM